MICDQITERATRIVSHPSMNGNPWDGSIAEFPGVQVDRFTLGALVYFLTHGHVDHMAGLENLGFNVQVHCTETTKALLATFPRYRHAVEKLVAHEYNTPFRVLVNGRHVVVTLVPAYHCPGAAVVLLESAHANVMVTGDVKAEKWWVESLARNPYVAPYCVGARQLHQLYFDLTFLYRGEPYIDMPPNSDGIAAVVSLLREYPMDDPDLEFTFTNKVLGAEEAVVLATTACLGRINPPASDLQARFNAMRNDRTSAVAYGPLLHQLVGPADTRARPVFHFAGSPNCKFPVTIKHAINFNIADLLAQFMPIRVESLTNHELRTELVPVGATLRGHRIYQFRGTQWLLPEGKSELLPQTLVMVYSRHASYSEIRHLVATLGPSQVFGCATFRPADLRQLWLAGASMKRLFGDLCPNTERFAYDNAMFRQYGHSPVTTPPQVINRWDPEVCAKERLMKLFGFFGQYERPIPQLRHTTDARAAVKERRRDLRIQGLIAGRNEHRYRDMFTRFQQLYRKHGLQVNGHDEHDHIKQMEEETTTDPTSDSTATKTGSRDKSSQVSQSPRKRPRLCRNSSQTLVQPSPPAKPPLLEHIAFKAESITISFGKRSCLFKIDDTPEPTVPVDTTRINEVATALEQSPSNWVSLRPRCVRGPPTQTNEI